MKSNKKLLIGIAGFIVVIVALLAIYFRFSPTSNAGAKDYTLIVVDDQGAEKEYTGSTDAEYLKGLMDELVADGDFSYEGTEADYGLFIESINGVTANFDADGAYWAIYVNGEYGQYGADSQPISDNDEFKFVYEAAQ